MLDFRSVARRIGIVTVARSDYGHLRPLLAALAAIPDVELSLYVAGAHLSPRFGSTVDLVLRDGWTIAGRVECTEESDAPEAITRALGRAVTGFGAALARSRPDLLVVFGDRYEMLAAALAALPLGVPVAHLHGGESSEGAIDEQLRHALTKLSHLHFAAAPAYAARIVQMGEEVWRVHCPGAPGLDRFGAAPSIARDALAARLGLTLARRTLLVTFHPVTLEPDAKEHHVAALAGALERVDAEIVVSYPGADAGHATVVRHWEQLARARPDVRLVPALGEDVYVSLLGTVDAMVGNSSSGIIEAASFRLPVVNVGTRQRGRLRGANVIDVGYDREAILAGIDRALAPAFRASLADLRNPYGDGHAAPRIARVLAEIELGPALITKRFVDAVDPR